MKAAPTVSRAARLLLTPVLRPLAPASILPGNVVVSGYLSDVTGIGRAGRLTADAVNHWPAEVIAHDIAADPRALTVPRDPGGVWIAHCNAPEAIGFMVRSAAHLWARRYRIGYWAYELERLPRDWKSGIGLFHEIWAPTQFVADAILAARGPTGPGVRVVFHPQPRREHVRPDRARFGIGPEFTCLAMFDGRSTVARKNPMGAIEAFQRAFTPESPARLIVKVVAAEAEAAAVVALRATIAGWPNIRLLVHEFSDDDVIQLIASVDLLISLHRSEGFGLPIAEAMTVGVPSLVTGWSGSAEFARGAAVEVPYGLIPAVDMTGHYNRPDLRWADPDLEAAAASLRRLADEPEWRAELSRAARRLAAERLQQPIEANHLEPFIRPQGEVQ